MYRGKGGGSKEFVVEGCPVRVRMDDVNHSKGIRIKKKSRRIVDFGMKRLDHRQKQALQNVMVAGAVDNPTKKKAAEDAGYAPTYALTAANKLLARRPIVEALEKAKVTDDKIAEVIAEGLEAKHPAYPENKDYHAIVKFVQEANRIKDNYPPTRVAGQVDTRSVVIHMSMDDAEAVAKFNRMRDRVAEAVE